MYLTLACLALLWLAGYLVSVRLHPNRACRWCRGAGRHVGRIFTSAHRPCRHCAGVGRRPRLGTRLTSRP